MPAPASLLQAVCTPLACTYARRSGQFFSLEHNDRLVNDSDTLDRRNRLAFLLVSSLSGLALVALFLAPCSIATQPEAWTGRTLLAQRTSAGELPERREGINAATEQAEWSSQDDAGSLTNSAWLVLVGALSCSLLVNVLLIRWYTQLQHRCHEFAAESQAWDQRAVQRVQR